MKVDRLIVGQLSTNCYLVWDGKSRDSVIIDPGDDAEYIIRRLQDLKLSPRNIVATHGHFDHVLGVTELKLAFNIPFLIHSKDLFLLKRAEDSSLFYLGVKADPVVNPDRLLNENDEINFGSQTLKVMETPGHTPGSISLIGVSEAFTGDTLFEDGIGRTDFSYSSQDLLSLSLAKIRGLNDKIILYPGHGEPVSVREAKNSQI